MITKFKIIELPLRASIQIDAIDVVINQEYHVTKQETMTVDVTDRGVPYDSFMYQLGNENGDWSQPLKATINAEVNNSTPIVTANQLTVPTVSNTDITADIVFNDSTDRVEIVDIDPKFGDLYADGQKLAVSSQIMLYKFKNVIFKSRAPLTSQEVTTTFTLRAGNSIGWGPTADIDITTTGNLHGIISGNTTLTTT